LKGKAGGAGQEPLPARRKSSNYDARLSLRKLTSHICHRIYSTPHTATPWHLQHLLCVCSWPEN